jgi:hypothetical protein
MLKTEHSFESAILDSQQLRPRRRSFAGDYISEEEDEMGGGFIHDESSPEAKPSGPNADLDRGADRRRG